VAPATSCAAASPSSTKSGRTGTRPTRSRCRWSTAAGGWTRSSARRHISS